MIQKNREQMKMKGTKKELQKQPQNNEKMSVSTHISIITLSVYGLNVLIKRHRLAEWIENQYSYICYLQQTHFRSKETSLKVRGWKKIFYANGNPKKPG